MMVVVMVVMTMMMRMMVIMLIMRMTTMIARIRIAMMYDADKNNDYNADYCDDAG